MKAQDLKKQLLNVVGPVDFSQTPLELLQKFADAETDETLRRYFFTLQDEAKNNCPDTDSLKELREAEHDMLCRLIQFISTTKRNPFSNAI